MSEEAPESRQGHPSPAGQPPPGMTTDSAPRVSTDVHGYFAAIKFGFLKQLQRRNIIRVGTLYLVACWLIIEPVHVVFHMLEVPVWANRLVIILMALGFPAIVLFAWVYEITPEGLKPTVEVEPQRSLRKLTAKRLDRALMVVLVLAITYLLADKFWLSKHVVVEPDTAASSPRTTPAAATAYEKSIAVLPFVDMSERKDQEYFADGMAEEIIDLLAKVPDLRVPARTSSFYFKGKSTKVADIARELGVAHVLEGSIRRSGNQIRVTAQLVRTENGFHLWSQTYDRDLQDVFKVQDDIANAVVQALQITLMGGPLTRQKGGTQNLEAYQLYLRAGGGTFANSKVALEAAQTYLEQAVKLDPDFALAWARLSFVTFELTLIRALPTTEGFERSRQLAQHALNLSPELIDPHWLLGYIHRTYDWDWMAAQDDARRALALDPTYPPALKLAGQVSATLGHFDDAERQLRAALVRDPLDTYTIFVLATAQYRTGRLAEAEATYHKLLEIAPGFTWAHEYLARTLLEDGKPEAALAMAQQEGGEAERLDILPIVLHAAGRQSEADEALNALISKYADRDAYCVAMNYAYRNDHDLALQWLERAYQQKEDGFVEIVSEPLFKNLANDGRYKAFLRKMHLPE